MASAGASRSRWPFQMSAARGWSARLGGPRLGIPQPRPAERLGAVEVHLVDVDAEGHDRLGAVVGAGVEHRRVGRQARPPVDPQRLAHARHDAEQPDRAGSPAGSRSCRAAGCPPGRRWRCGGRRARTTKPGGPPRGDASPPWGPDVASTANVDRARNSRGPGIDVVDRLGLHAGMGLGVERAQAGHVLDAMVERHPARLGPLHRSDASRDNVPSTRARGGRRGRGGPTS